MAARIDCRKAVGNIVVPKGTQLLASSVIEPQHMIAIITGVASRSSIARSGGALLRVLPGGQDGVRSFLASPPGDSQNFSLFFAP
jgi:hypothetical protein